MTREEFLSKKWKAYPAIPHEVFGLILGRVALIEKDQVQLVRNSSPTSISLSDENQHEDEEMGLSIPSQLLRVGDVVAYHKNSSCFYLISPCFKKSQHLFSNRPHQWSYFLHQVKSFFYKEEFLEILTPYLVSSPGVDHHIEFFEVKGTRTGSSWYLPTSPEINLKKYLCQGHDKIFEVKNCFRDDLNSSIHLPEFTMLEWYRSYESLDKIKEDIRGLIRDLTKEELSFRELTVTDCFKQFLNFDLKVNTSAEELRKITQELEIDSHSTDDWNDLFFRLFIEKIEPQLEKIKDPVFLSDFPQQQASLSKVNNQGWSERFELYWKGIELANAYLEVNDPSENLKIFNRENSKRKSDSLTLPRLDQDFFEELQSGMPPASGVALGLNRLFMVLKGEKSI